MPSAYLYLNLRSRILNIWKIAAEIFSFWVLLVKRLPQAEYLLIPVYSISAPLAPLFFLGGLEEPWGESWQAMRTTGKGGSGK